MIIDNVKMDFCHECKVGPNTPDAYERLIHDVMADEQTLFTRWDEVQEAWKITDKIKKSLQNKKIVKYEAGTWGPKEADLLIQMDKRKWIEPQKPSYSVLLQ